MSLNVNINQHNNSEAQDHQLNDTKNWYPPYVHARHVVVVVLKNVFQQHVFVLANGFHHVFAI